MKTFQKTLQIILLSISGLSLILIIKQILQSNYSTNHLCLIILFCLPVLACFGISASLLTQKK
jgi:hypothetical protein